MAAKSRDEGTKNEKAEEKDPLLAEVGDKVLTARRRIGLRQADLARKSGLTQSSVFLIENGRQNATLKALQALAGALGLQIRDLVPGEDHPQAEKLDDVRLVADGLTAILGRATLVLQRLENAVGVLDDLLPPDMRKK